MAAKSAPASPGSLSKVVKELSYDPSSLMQQSSRSQKLPMRFRRRMHFILNQTRKTPVKFSTLLSHGLVTDSPSAVYTLSQKSRLPPKTATRHSSNSSQLNLVYPNTNTYTFERYIPRSLLNTLGPLLLTALYFFILFVYLLRPSLNDVAPYFPVDAKTVFYAWLILSVFVLDWAKSGLAGFEASALMKPSLAPKTALQLMWHADRAWGSLSGWWNALSALSKDLRCKLPKREHHTPRGPAILWWYLSFSSFVLYLAIPLAGLTMDPKDSLQVSTRKILILGPNQTSFDTLPSNRVAEAANSRWRQGNPTTPQGDTVLYAPQGAKNISRNYFNDAVENIYAADLSQSPVLTSPLSFFSGPQVSERAHGKAWGLLTDLTCSVTHPYHGLELINITAMDKWKLPSISSTFYETAFNGSETYYQAQFLAGMNPGLFYEGQSSFGVNYKYLIASNGVIDGTVSDYTNSSSLPVPGSLELVMWQAYKAPFSPDAIFLNMSSHSSAVVSVWPYDNTTYLGYAIRCSVNSTVGFAHLDAATHAYSNFVPEAASLGQIGLPGQLNEYPGMLGIQSIVYASFTTAILKYAAPPVCQPGDSATCNPWYGANVATKGEPQVMQKAGHPTAKNLQYPTLSPERMKLAIYKLFGEAAIAMMASGPGTWTGELHGLDKANDMVPGKVPWQFVVALLSLWTLITVVPNYWTFWDRRWAAMLDGVEMFRLGAEWRSTVWKLKKREFVECDALLDVPGMVGDMEPVSINADTFKLTDNKILLQTATNFLQGLYPPLGDLDHDLVVDTVTDGSNIMSPLNGYQFIPIHGKPKEAPDTIWLKGDDSCPAYTRASDSYHTSVEYLSTVDSSRKFYSQFAEPLNNVMPPENVTYAHAYDVFDLLNVGSIHNESFASAVTTPQLSQLRYYADALEWGHNYNLTQPARSIGGMALAGGILRQLNQTVSTHGNLKFSLMAGSYDTFLAFFGLTNLTALNADFMGLPGYASSMAFELFTDANTTTLPRDTADLRVRFLFRNGTDESMPLIAFPLFDRNSISYDDFVDELGSRAINSVGEWCSTCQLSDGFCSQDAYVSSSGDSSSSNFNYDDSSSGLTAVHAGVIGAMTTLGVLAIVALAVFFCRRTPVSASRSLLEKRSSGSEADSGISA
ncbi:MAG: hypothetical protein Q9198_000293 [Flavoplaca austrocitrina]